MLKICYGIQCHKNSEQVILLVNAIVNNGNIVYIHVDLSADHVFEVLDLYFKNVAEVTVIKNRIDVTWSGFSQVQATLNLLVESVRQNYDYFILLSGEDVPLTSNEKLVNFLVSVNEKSVLEVKKQPVLNWRVNRFNFFSELKYNRSLPVRSISFLLRKTILRIFKRKNFKSDDIYYGSSWVCLHKNHINELLFNNIDSFNRKFMYTACSDEHYFQSWFMMHSPTQFLNTRLHFVKFHNSSSPVYLTNEQLTELSNHGEHFFARKVDAETAKRYLDECSE
ncbi:beta-1,6-N-acetylglucosaminyltransferase [Vibrio alginolyticus]|uniref:beta-1,6-N-acetylglucosaminyltransferase n=1 Tax=Vibrio alginolyticus TaxID=663 RepID=UPI0037544F04